MVGDVESVAFVFTRPAFEVRQAEQDGGGNIYMTVGGNIRCLYGQMSPQDEPPPAHCEDAQEGLCVGTDPRLTSWMCAAENTQMNR